MQYKKSKIYMRKSDARKKIQLGGLVIKAGLDYLHPEKAYVLYGMLLDCESALKRSPLLLEKWAALGKELLTNDKNVDSSNDDNKEIVV